MSEGDLQAYQGKPETAEVIRSDGKPLEANVPAYLVWPASPKHEFLRMTTPEIRLVDFGEAFELGSEPKILRTPLPDRWKDRYTTRHTTTKKTQASYWKTGWLSCTWMR